MANKHMKKKKRNSRKKTEPFPKKMDKKVKNNNRKTIEDKNTNGL